MLPFVSLWQSRSAWVMVLVGMGVWCAAAATAQTPAALGGPASCGPALAEAQQRYVAQDYRAVEALVLRCVHRPEVTPAQVQRGYRLLTLAYLRQDQIRDARGSALTLLGADYAYEPDPVQDPPDYVALLRSVKDQLRVTARPIPPPGTSPDVRAPTPVVNLNAATAAELATVPGLDDQAAERIVTHRTLEGRFQSVDDLARVPGLDTRAIGRAARYLTTVPAQRTTGGRAASPAEASSAPQR